MRCRSAPKTSRARAESSRSLASWLTRRTRKTWWSAGLSRCTGGSFVGNPDPWLSFGPDGVLYFITGGNDSSAGRHGVLTSKSLDGGLHWLGPVTLWDTTDKRLSPDYPRITADPTDARLVYAIWCNVDSGNRGGAVFTRSTD